MQKEEQRRIERREERGGGRDRGVKIHTIYTCVHV